MKEALTNLVRLQPQNVVSDMLAVGVVVWMAVLILAFTSIASQRAWLVTKISWAVVVVALPLGGMFAYCIYCACRQDYSQFAGFMLLRKGRAKGERRDGAVAVVEKSETSVLSNAPYTRRGERSPDEGAEVDSARMA